MISILRLTELYKLCDYLQASKGGRKYDLQQRIVGALQSASGYHYTDLAKRITELHAQCIGDFRSVHNAPPPGYSQNARHSYTSAYSECGQLTVDASNVLIDSFR